MRIWNALNDETGFPYLFSVSVVKAHLFRYCKQSLTLTLELLAFSSLSVQFASNLQMVKEQRLLLSNYT